MKCAVSCRIKKNAKVCIYSLADLNIGHCVELAFLDLGQVGLISYINFLKMKFLKLIAK